MASDCLARLFQENRHPRRWLESALRLKRAADAVRPIAAAHLEALVEAVDDGPLPATENDLAAVYLLLAGLALENAVKGILEAKQPGERIWRTHRLAQLFTEAQIHLEGDEERALVTRLAGFIEWAGRYPVPVEPQDLAPIAVPFYGRLTPGVQIFGDEALTEGLLTRVIGLLRTTLDMR